MFDFIARHGAEAERGECLALGRPVDPAAVALHRRRDARVRGGERAAHRFGIVGAAPHTADACDEYHRLVQCRARVGIGPARSGRHASIRRRNHARRRLSRRIDACVVGWRCASPSQELPVEGLGGRFRRHVEIAPQCVATGAVLAQRVGVATLARQRLHQVALRALVRRLDGHQPLESRDRACVVADCRALSRHPFRRTEQQPPQLAATFDQPLLECG